MPERVRDLPTFLSEISKLIQLVDQCGPVLFRRGFRKNLASSSKDVSGHLDRLKKLDALYVPDKFPEMVNAGLSGPQLELKLESFESALVAFEAEGNVERLEDVLGVGGTLLGSLAGAIPGFGSFAQELVDFILKELKRRFWGRRRDG